MSHSEHGASIAERWMNCPGSVAFVRSFEKTSTPYSREGTVAHGVAAMALRADVSAFTFVGRTFMADGFEIEVTDDMAAAIQEYLDHVNERVEAAGPNARQLIEQSFSLHPLAPPAPMWGTTDHALWTPETRTLEITDYKHGAGVAVDAHENEQLTYYALGAIVALNQRPETITLTIVQPRAFHRDGPIRTHTLTWDELVAFKRNLFAAADRSLQPDAPLVPGEWCRFCPGRAHCPAQKSVAVAVAQAEFTADLTLKAPDRLTEEEVLQVMSVAGTIEAWLRSVRQHVQQKLEMGEEVPGWKLVPKRATRRWANEDTVVEWAAQQSVEPFKRVLLSPAQLEAEIKLVYPPRQRPKLPDDLVVATSSGSTLAPATDDRPAIMSARHEFTALPQGDATE